MSSPPRSVSQPVPVQQKGCRCPSFCGAWSNILFQPRTPSHYLEELMFAGQYVWYMQEMRSDCHVQAFYKGSPACIYRRYDSIGRARVCSGWGDSCRWKQRICDSGDPPAQHIHTGKYPSYHSPDRLREASAALDQTAAWKPIFPLDSILWILLCIGNEVCRTARWQQSGGIKRCKHAGLHCSPSRFEGWICASYYGRWHRCSCFVSFCRLRMRFTASVSAHAIRYKAAQEAVDYLRSHKTESGDEYQFCACPPWYVFRSAYGMNVKLLSYCW